MLQQCYEAFYSDRFRGADISRDSYQDMRQVNTCRYWSTQAETQIQLKKSIALQALARPLERRLTKHRRKLDCLVIYDRTTRECVHLVTRGHSQSRDKDGGHTIRSAVVQNPMLHANFMAVCFIEPELLPIEVLHCENRNFRPVCLAPVTLTLTR